LCLWAGSGPKQSKALVITNVNVVDTRSGVVHPGMTVIISGQEIASVTKVAVVTPGPRVQLVNANGAFMVPGLWDMNIHLARVTDAATRDGWLKLYLSAGVTGIRDMDAVPAGVAPLRPELEPAFGGGSMLTRQPRERRSIEDLGEVFRACNAALGLNDQSDPSVPAAEKPGRFPHCDPVIAHRIFVEISNNATWVVPTLAAQEISVDVEPALADAAVRQPQSVEPSSSLIQDRQLVREMHTSGVQFLAGTDGPSANSGGMRTVQRELELLGGSGLSPFEALQTATFNPALYMAKLDKYGVVERGHVADLVLLERNPLEDIRNTEKIAAVILRGQYLSQPELARMRSQAVEEIDKVEKSASAGSN
jgi:hypothetical protein